MRPPKHLPTRIPLPVDDLEARWHAGDSTYALADAYGVGPWVIRARLNERGVDTSRRAPWGPGHYRWKGGRYPMKNGYVKVWLGPDDPLVEMADENHTALEHRVTMARHLDRPLTASESVHHIDGNRANNAIENLQLRQRHHGKGHTARCGDCGSVNIIAETL